MHRSAIGLLSLALLVALTASACDISISVGNDVDGSGNLVTETFDLSEFDRIDVRSAFDVDISIGPTSSVLVEADDNIAEHLDIRVRDGVLRVDLDGVSLSRGTLRATIQLPELTSLEASGATSIRVNGIDSSTFELDVSGASEVEVQGSVTELILDASGASELSLDNLAVQSASVQIAGASDVELGDADQVQGDVSGASDLTISSDANADIETSGASSLHRS